MMVLDHVRNLKVFNHNALIPFSIRLCRLKMVIAPLAIDLEMGFCGVFCGFTTSMTPLFASAHMALFAPHRSLRGAIETGILDGVSFAIRQERFQANIHPNSR